MKQTENLRELRDIYMQFFKQMVNEWSDEMIIDYLKANGLPKRKEDREVIIMRIIDHEFDYICQASSEDLKDQFAIWKQLLNASS